MQTLNHSWLTAEFSAYKCKDAKVEWFDNTVWSEAHAASFAYCTIVQADRSAQQNICHKIFLADRYGGPGTGFHGGSARCGISDDVQVKGIGITPLLTTRPDAKLDRWHFNGMLDIFEAVREAIWSKICQSALPYGAVPALGVIICKENIQSSDASPIGVVKTSPRALLLRRPAWRPAHFLRNLHFISGDKFTSWEHDRSRTIDAIKALPGVFEAQLGVHGHDTASILNGGLVEMAKRFADQAAASFSRRIFHGALNPSNIAVDGRFLDFGTMSCVPGFRRRTGAPAPDGPDFWVQHESLAFTLRLLRSQIAKYSSECDKNALISAQELLAAFQEAYSERSSVELLKLLGADERFISNYPPSKSKRLVACIVSIICRGASRPFAWFGDDDPATAGLQPMKATGRYELSKILCSSVKQASDGWIHIDPHDQITDTALATEFCCTAGEFLNTALVGAEKLYSVGDSSLLLDEIRRRNAEVSFLTREALDSSIKDISVNGGDYGKYIDRTVSAALHIMKY
jgi:hypothetical protein